MIIGHIHSIGIYALHTHSIISLNYQLLLFGGKLDILFVSETKIGSSFGTPQFSMNGYLNIPIRLK